MDLQTLSLHPDPGRLRDEGCQCQHGMAESGIVWHHKHSMAWHSVAWHRTPSLAPAGSAGREVPTELCFSSQLKEKERNKEGNEMKCRCAWGCCGVAGAGMEGQGWVESRSGTSLQ